MEARKFAIGDQVFLRLDSYTNNNPADVYTVSRVLPAMANVWQYRVKRVGDGQERAVNEQQLANAASATIVPAAASSPVAPGPTSVPLAKAVLDPVWQSTATK